MRNIDSEIAKKFGSLKPHKSLDDMYDLLLTLQKKYNITISIRHAGWVVDIDGTMGTDEELPMAVCLAALALP